MESAEFLDALHHELLVRALAYFFPESVFERGPEIGPPVPDLAVSREGERALALDWLGTRYSLRRAEFDFTDHDHRLLRAIGRFLGARHRFAQSRPTDAGVFRLFGGRAEDHVVSAWLDLAASGDAPTRMNAERIDD